MGNSFSDFESFCSRLRSNDPTADLINTDNFPYFESEEAGKLGDALLLRRVCNNNNHNARSASAAAAARNNSNSNNSNNDAAAAIINHHVRQIIMDVTNLDVRHDGRGVESIARFLKTSRTMKALYLKSPGLGPMAALQQHPGGHGGHHGGGNNLAHHYRTVGNVVSTLVTAVATSSGTIDELVFGNVDLATPCQAFCKLLVDSNEEGEGTAAAAAAAGYTCCVKRLRISFGREVTEQQARVFQRAFGRNTSLQACELAGLPDGTFAACMAGMQDNTHLKSLRLDRIGGQSDNESLRALLENNTTIRSLSVSQTMGIDIPSLVASLQRNDTLVDLALVECHLMEHHAAHLKLVVRNCHNLESLSVSKNYLENDGFAQIAEGLHRNRTLKFFDISDNGISGPHASVILRDLLRRNRSLTRLDIDRNHFGYRALTLQQYRDTNAYTHGLARNKSLQELDMSHCGLGDASMEMLATTSIQHNCTLQVLAVARNNISHVGIQHLANAMHVTRSITALALSYNDLGDAGIMILAQMLRQNIVPLSKLFLDETLFGNDGALALASAMRQSKMLQVLSVEDNRFDEVGVRALMNSLPHVTQLVRWDFTWRQDYYPNPPTTTSVITGGTAGQGAQAQQQADGAAAGNDLVSLLHSSLVTNKTLLTVNIAGYKPKPKDRILMDFCASRNRLLPLVQGEQEGGGSAVVPPETAATTAAADTTTTTATAAPPPQSSTMPMELWPDVLAQFSQEPNPKHEPSTIYWLLGEVLVSVCQYAATTTKPTSSSSSTSTTDAATSTVAAASAAAPVAQDSDNNNATATAAGTTTTTAASAAPAATSTGAATAASVASVPKAPPTKKPASSRKRAPRTAAAAAASATKGRAAKSSSATAGSKKKRASSPAKRKEATTVSTQTSRRPVTRVTRSRAVAVANETTTTTTTSSSSPNAAAAATTAPSPAGKRTTQAGRKRKRNNS